MKCLVESKNSMNFTSIGKYNWLTGTLRFNETRRPWNISHAEKPKSAFVSHLICAAFFLSIVAILIWSLTLLAAGDLMRPILILVTVFVYSAMSLAPLAQEHAPAPESEAVPS
jgi:hypothetical protein